MIRTIRVIALSGVFGLFAMSLGYQARAQEQSISKTEIRKQDPERTHERLRDIFWQTLELEDRRSETEPERALGNVRFESKLFPTRVPGLCRYDTLGIEFERIEGDYDTPTAQARPVGFRSSSFFRFVSPPLDDYSEIVLDNAVLWDGCVNATKDGNTFTPDGKKIGAFFSAPDEERATDGYVSFLAMTRMARAGLTENFECQLHHTEKIECGTLIARYRPEAIRSISSCESEASDQCFEYFIDDRRIRAVSPFRWPEEVDSVRLESLIVLSHEAID